MYTHTLNNESEDEPNHDSFMMFWTCVCSTISYFGGLVICYAALKSKEIRPAEKTLLAFGGWMLTLAASENTENIEEFSNTKHPGLVGEQQIEILELV